MHTETGELSYEQLTKIDEESIAADLGEFQGLGTIGVMFGFLINLVNTSINRLFNTNAQAMKLIARIKNRALLPPFNALEYS